MTQINAPTSYSLAGFVGDFQGDTASLRFYRPILRQGSSLYAALTNDWIDSNDLSPLADGDPYIKLRENTNGSPLQMLPGEGIWLAGLNFVNRCADVSPVGTRMRHWHGAGSTHKYRTGSRADFDEFSTRIFNDAAHKLAQCLTDSEDVRAGRAEVVFQVLNHLHTVDPLEQAVQRGLYYRETSDFYRYALISSDAVRDGLVQPPNGFDHLVSQRIKMIKEEKLRDYQAIDGSADAAKPRSESLSVLADSLMQLRALSTDSRLIEIILSRLTDTDLLSSVRCRAALEPEAGRSATHVTAVSGAGK